MKERSIIMFEQGVKSQSTLKNYLDHLNKFREFSNMSSYDSIVKLPVEKLQILVEDYIIHLKNTCHPNSVPILMLGVRHFFIMNRIPIQWEIIRKMYPQKLKSAGSKPWTTEQIQLVLKSTTSKRNIAFIHFLASTGARIGVLDYDLSMKHLDDMDHNCKSILLYPDDTEEYWGFLTPEASKALEEYFDERKKAGEKFSPDTPIFRNNFVFGSQPVKPWKTAGATAMMYRLIKNTGISRTRVNHHFDIQMDHGFRKRFNTVLKLKNEVNSNIAEKLMGHKNGLDGVYLKPTREECFAEFIKAIPELTIDSTKRQRIKIQQLEQENEDKKQLEEKIQKLQKEQQEMKQYYRNQNDLVPMLAHEVLTRVKLNVDEQEFIRAVKEQKALEK